MPDSTTVLAIQSDPTDPPGLVGEWLAEVGIAVTVVHAHAGEPVPSTVPDGIHGLLPLGGAMAAWEDEVAPWLPDTRALLADAVDRGVPVLGLCLGGQLLAGATGGRLGVAPVAEVGVVTVGPTADAAADEVFARVPGSGDPATRLPAAQWHGDAILDLPDGAVLLATNEACPVQAFRVGDSAWGLQFHPEVDGAIIGSWVGDDDGPLLRAGRVGVDIGAEVDDALAGLVRAWRPLTHAWADVVRRYAAGREARPA
ncbi:MAG: type 1 glutamine amidotransferase [Candidatus Nanopelagicales bacterium]